MHPEFISALARERRADLLRQQQFRHTRDRQPRSVPTRERPVMERARLGVGRTLVTLGTRLASGPSTAPDLVDVP
jgi:hypothetical protein